MNTVNKSTNRQTDKWISLVFLLIIFCCYCYYYCCCCLTYGRTDIEKLWVLFLFFLFFIIVVFVSFKKYFWVFHSKFFLSLLLFFRLFLSQTNERTNTRLAGAAGPIRVWPASSSSSNLWRQSCCVLFLLCHVVLTSDCLQQRRARGGARATSQPVTPYSAALTNIIFLHHAQICIFFQIWENLNRINQCKFLVWPPLMSDVGYMVHPHKLLHSPALHH